MLNEEMKMKLFNEMLYLETMANEKTYDGRNYFEQMEGAFKMLAILGIEAEYIKWLEGKEAK